MAVRLDKRVLLGCTISVVVLALLFRSIDVAQLAAAFARLDYVSLLLAILVTLVSYLFRALRWHYLLLPVKKAAPGNLVAATFICYMANNLLPARLGEFIRAYVLAQKEGLDVSTVFATLVLDRLWDGFAVLVILVVTLFSVSLPPGMEQIQQGLVTGGYVTLLVYLLVVLFLVVLKRSTHTTLRIVGTLLRPLPVGVSARVIPMLGAFIAGMRLPASAGELAGIMVATLLTWLTALWPIHLLLQGFGLGLPFTAAMFVMVFLVFAVMVPASPGYVGTFHAACMYGLMAFAVPKETALSVAFVVHAVNFFPVIILGILSLWLGKMSMATLRSCDQ
jgi:uncharacterized protein (TIRG00374 family)